MTRKDYVLLASLLKQALANSQPANQFSTAMHFQCVALIADGLALDNPRFDRKRFLNASGVQS